MDDIWGKQLVNVLQRQYQIANTLAFVPLIQIVNGNIQIIEKGLRVIQSLLPNKIYLVSLYSKKQTIINAIYRPKKDITKNNNQTHSGIWIANKPRFDKDNNCYFLYLESFSLNPQDQIKLHIILALLCWTIIIDADQYQKIKILGSINGRIIHDSKQQNINKGFTNRKKQLSNIAILRYQDTNVTMKRPLQQLKTLIKNLYFDEKIIEIYQEISLLSLSQKKLLSKNDNQTHQMQRNIQDLCYSCNKNGDLHEGPILIGYLQQIVNSLNHKSIVQISQSMNHIQICGGYDAYQRSVQFYNNNIKKQIKQDGMANLNIILKHIRQDTVLQFNKESNEALYLTKLNQYINSKEEYIKEQNNKVVDLKNLQYLQKSSDELFTKIDRQKLSRDQIEKHLQQIKEDYIKKSYGDNKFQLLSNYIHTVHTTLNKDTNRLAQLEKKSKRQLQFALQEKKLHEDRAAKLQKQIKTLQQAQRNQQQSSKCCEIM